MGVTAPMNTFGRFVSYIARKQPCRLFGTKLTRPVECSFRRLGP